MILQLYKQIHSRLKTYIKDMAVYHTSPAESNIELNLKT